MSALTDAAIARDGGCVIGGDCSRVLEAHHVIKQQTIKNQRHLADDQIEEALGDVRGVVTLCKRHHGQVHAGMERLSPMLLMQTEFYIPGDHVEESTFTGDYDLRPLWEGIVAKQLPTHRRLEV